MVIQLVMVSILVRLPVGAKNMHFCEAMSQQTLSELVALFTSPPPFNVHHRLFTQ